MAKRSTKWVSTSKAATELGVSASFLRQQRDRLYKKGKHYRVLNPTAWRPTYQWNVAKIRELMEV